MAACAIVRVVSDAAHHEEEALGRSYDARLMRRLLGYLRPYRGATALAVVLIGASALLQLVGPLATAVALDLFVAPDDPAAPRAAVSRAVTVALDRLGLDPDPAAGLAAAALVYLLALVAGFGVVYGQGYLMQMVGQRVMADLRAEIFGHLQRLEVAYFDRTPVGRMVTRATTDVDALNELFSSGIVTLFGDVLQLVGIVGVLFWLDWRLALAAFAVLPLLFLLTFWFKVKARASFREVRVRVARINAFLQEHVAGMAVVQLFGREARAATEFSRHNRDHRDAHVRGIFYYAVYYPGIELLTAAGLGLVLWVGGGQTVRGALSVGALVAFLQYAQRFYQPLADLSEKYNVLQAAMASSERIFALLDTPPAVAAPARPHAPERVEGAIEFSGVRFGYLPGEPVLRDLSFRVAAGEMVAIVGHTGAGKSTLANLLLRFYDVDRGAVRLDGVDVRAWDLARLRRSVGVILQDVFLFSGSVADNLRLGEAGFDDERLRRAAAEAQALGFVERLPGGLGAPVRERGAGLSVGQKQLLAFARALAFDPRVLVLDEATASVDSETERLLQVALDRLLAGRTSLVIAHRLSTVQRADRILVLHKGELREQGTHAELVARRGIYHRLYQLQYGRAA